MIVLAYNCRGLENPHAVTALKGIVDEQDPDILFLSETKLKYGELKRVRQRLRYGNKVYVDCEGSRQHRRGGLAMFWKSHLQLELNSYSLHHVDMAHLDENGEATWRITGVYGYPNEGEKHKTWALLQSLNMSDLPWLCFGDFNEILGQHEKTGNNGKNQALVRGFSGSGAVM